MPICIHITFEMEKLKTGSQWNLHFCFSHRKMNYFFSFEKVKFSMKKKHIRHSESKKRAKLSDFGMKCEKNMVDSYQFIYKLEYSTFWILLSRLELFPVISPSYKIKIYFQPQVVGKTPQRLRICVVFIVNPSPNSSAVIYWI